MNKLIFILLSTPFFVLAQNYYAIDKSYNKYLINTFAPSFDNLPKSSTAQYNTAAFSSNPTISIATTFGVGDTYEEALFMAQILWSSKFFGSYGYVTDDYQNPATKTNLMREILQVKMNVIPTLVLKEHNAKGKLYTFSVVGFKKIKTPVKTIFYNYTTEGKTGIGSNYRLNFYGEKKPLTEVNLNSKSFNSFSFNGAKYQSSKTTKQLVYFQHFSEIKSQANAAAVNVSQVADYYNASGRDLKRLSQKGKVQQTWGITNLAEIFEGFTL